MKNVIQKAGLVIGVALLAFTACKKEDLKKVTDTVNSDTEMVALVDQAGNELINEPASKDAPETGIALLNEGIATDFLVIAADFDEVQGPAGNDDSMRQFIRSHSFIACLKRLELSDRQKEGIKKSMMAYENCKESAVKRARAIYAKLREQYHAKFERILAAYKNGDMTREEFKDAVHRLRMAFNKELHGIHLNEKLDAAFKDCYRNFLGNIKQILNEKQWAAFVACHRK